MCILAELIIDNKYDAHKDIEVTMLETYLA